MTGRKQERTLRQATIDRYKAMGERIVQQFAGSTAAEMVQMIRRDQGAGACQKQ